jgi:hypothetical protein
MQRNNLIKKVTAFIFTISAIILVASSSWATTYYVSTSGNNSNNGTATTTPYQTIQNALNHVAAGDTVNIMSGTYNESLVIMTSGTSTKRITIQPYNSGTVTINSGSNQTVRINSSSPTGYYTFNSLTFTSTKSSTGDNYASVDLGIGSPGWWGWGAPTDNTKAVNDDSNGYNGFILDHCTINGSVGFMGHYNIVRYCRLEGNNSSPTGIHDKTVVSHHNLYDHNTVHNYTNRGYWGMANISYTTVSNSTFYNDTNGSSKVGVDFDCLAGGPGSYNTISNNIVYNQEVGLEFENGLNSTMNANIVYNCNQGIDIINYGANSGTPNGLEYRNVNTNNVVMNNIVYKCTSVAIELICSPGNSVYNNTLDGNSGAFGAIALINQGTSFGSSNSIIKNNIITNSSRGVVVESNTNNVTVTNNLFYNNSSNGTVGTANVLANPLYIDGTGHNYNLQSSSPAIGKGTAVASVTTDFLGTSRMLSSTYDIGAYAFKTATTVIAPLSAPTGLTVQ